MHSLQHIFMTLAAVSVFVSPSLSLPRPEAVAGADCTGSTTSEYCVGTAFNSTLLDQYICGDWRLGPVVLPMTPPLSSHIMELYHRFGTLSPGAFLKKWWDPVNGTWIYPLQEGFSLDVSTDPNGAPIKGNLILPAGTVIDRFGSEYGKFFSPASAPYLQRALPPSNLDTPQNDPQ